MQALDEHLTGLLAGAPLLAVLGLAVLLGLRHATDPDHLVAVTALVAHERGGVRRAAQLGAWWGAGHATVLLVLGAVLIVADAHLPGGLESGAEAAVGVVIVALALRVLLDRRTAREPREPRGPLEAAAVGTLHGVAGTGAIVLLLVAAIPDRTDAALALAAFAPMSVVSMSACTALFGWAIARHAVARVAIPALGLGALVFGVAYVGSG